MLENKEQKENTSKTTQKKQTEKEVEKMTNNETLDKKEEKFILNFSTLTLEELLESLKKIVHNEPIQKIKNQVNDLKLNFNKKLKELIEAKKEAFIAEGGNEIDFHFTIPIKNTFFSVFKDYRNKVQHYYNQKEIERKGNFIKKTALVEELKLLISNSESSTMYSELKTIQEKWRETGPVPFEKNEDIWQTFRFHEQKVYDFLHLRSDFRNLDFKHNLEKKTKIVERAIELTQELDNAKAFKELQILHRLWKEDIGPVAREFREEVWEKFSTATKVIHDKRNELFAELEVKWEENIPKKEEVVQKIKQLIDENITSHNAWQNKIKELESLRNEFFKIGKVTNEKKEELWQALREATRNFNKKKNEFYKNIKEEHQENLDKKKALIEKAISLKNAENFKETTEIYKKIQAEWKKIGHVPRKFSDKLWKEFRGACNHFFDRMHTVQDEENKELLEVFNAKKEYLEQLKSVEKVTLEEVKEYIVAWRNFGNVPQNMRFIESKFNKLIDKLFAKLDIDKNESVLLRFKNNIDSFVVQNNTRKLDNEMLFIRKRVDEITKEIKLLENNLGFFKHTPTDNPMVKGVYKNIEKQQLELTVWKQKLKYLNSVEY
ncbi:MAG: DUF349 domain-containing protein [Flavobacteriaceae bacterium]|nr:DUF349 domain-containing protein [Flavobacteriaceae bacterium]